MDIYAYMEGSLWKLYKREGNNLYKIGCASFPLTEDHISFKESIMAKKDSESKALKFFKVITPLPQLAIKGRKY